MFSVEPAHARLHRTRLAGGENRSPVVEQRWQVLRVDRRIPAPAAGLIETETRVVAPALIQEVDVSIRQRSPYQSGKRIDNTSEIVLQRCVPLASDPRGHSACGTQGRTSIILSYRSTGRGGASVPGRKATPSRATVQLKSSAPARSSRRTQPG